MWHVYEDFYKETMAIPYVSGRRAEHEKFAGAPDAYSVEALMHAMVRQLQYCYQPFLR